MLCAVRYKQPFPVIIRTEIVYVKIIKRCVFRFIFSRRQNIENINFNLAHIFKSRNNSALVKCDIFTFCKFFFHIGAICAVNIFGRSACNYHLAVRRKFLQNFKRTFAQTVDIRQNNRAVFHFADLEIFAVFPVKFRQFRLANKVKINVVFEQNICNFKKIRVDFIARKKCFGVGSAVHPVAFSGVDNADADNRFSTCQCGVEPCKVIFDKRIFLIPRRLIIYRRRVITLALTAHRKKCQVRNAERHAQSRLPVTLKFVVAEIKIPACDAVKLGHHTLSAVLIFCRLRLFCSLKLNSVAQKVNARNGERTVETHCFGSCARLNTNSVLLHQMSRKRNAELIAFRFVPVCKCAHKKLTAHIKIIVAHLIIFIAVLIEKLGQTVENVISAHLFKFVLKMRAPRNEQIFLAFLIFKRKIRI